MAFRGQSDGAYRTYETYGTLGTTPYETHKSHRAYKPHLSQRESLGELIGELASQAAGLARDELALARRELEQKLRTVQSAAAVVAIGAIIALIAALSICAAVIIALAEYVRPWQSALIVGLILGMAAGVVLSIGVSRFKRISLKPEQTIETLEENRAWLKDLT